jgi:hypothetical protein
VVCYTMVHLVDICRHPHHAVAIRSAAGVYFNMSFPLMLTDHSQDNGGTHRLWSVVSTAILDFTNVLLGTRTSLLQVGF